MMIRGINRYAVEVRHTRSPYFERAICFVKPEYTGMPGLDLHRAAQDMIFQLDAGVEAGDARHKKSAKNSAVRWFPLMLAIGLGVLLGLGLGLIMMNHAFTG